MRPRRNRAWRAHLLHRTHRVSEHQRPARISFASSSPYIRSWRESLKRWAPETSKERRIDLAKGLLGWQAARRKATAVSRATVRNASAWRAQGGAGFAAGQFARDAGHTDTRATIRGQRARPPTESTDLGHRAASIGVAHRRGVTAFGGFLARHPGGLATMHVRAAKNSLGDRSTGTRTTVVVGLATLVLGETTTRALAAPVRTARARTTILGRCTSFGDDRTARQGLALGRSIGAHLA